jgi:hypothetical protein
MDMLNKEGIATPFDQDGDLFPAIMLGFEDIAFPNLRRLDSMIGEIGGSAEWAVGVLPLVWRGGQAIGMLTSQSSLSRKDLSPEELWQERLHYTEEEFMLIQDARFEHKPFFTIKDILEEPFAGGISAFGAITDNYYLPILEGVKINRENKQVQVNVLSVNSLGIMECWHMAYECKASIDRTADLMKSPKEKLAGLESGRLEAQIGRMLSEPKQRGRYRIFFNNEYYPALIPVRDKMVILQNAIGSLIDRGAIDQHDVEIIRATQRLAPEWFVNAS